MFDVKDLPQMKSFLGHFIIYTRPLINNVEAKMAPTNEVAAGGYATCVFAISDLFILPLNLLNEIPKKSNKKYYR